MLDFHPLIGNFKDFDGSSYCLDFYDPTDEILTSHFDILNSSQADTLNYKNTDLLSLSTWVNTCLSNPSEFLFSIFSNDDKRLVGTAKASLNHTSKTFSVGILIASHYSTGRNIDRLVKGCIINRLFHLFPLYLCTGGCLSSNLRSISFYKFFDFKFSHKSSSRGFQNIHFSLSNDQFLNRLGSFFSVPLLNSGFLVKDFSSSDLLLTPIADLPGYSSLSYFSLISICLDLGDHFDIIDLYDLNTLLDFSLFLGPSVFLISNQ